MGGTPKFTLGAISPKVARSYIIRNGSEKAGCPSPSSECRAKSYLIAGDEVLLGRTNGAFVCTQFVTAKKNWSAGWLLAADLVPAAAPPSLAAWVGTWEGGGTITIKPAVKAGALAIKGSAAFRDNSGEIEAVAVPDGANLSFTMDGGDKTLPVDQGEGCKVWMGRGRRNLIVADNGQCGGVNVSFEGVYTRR